MSAWYMLLDQRFSVHSNPVGRKRLSMVTMVKVWMARRQAIKELEGLSDRLLSDIGISRYEIPAIVDGARTAENIHRIMPVRAKVTVAIDEEVLAA